MFRRYSRPSARRRSLGNVIQSYKKVLNYAPASLAITTTHNFPISAGVDSVAAGQTSATDANVPTGSVIKGAEIQFSVTNLTSQSQYFWATVQRIHTGQVSVSGRAVGGSQQRNQVHRQLQFQVGKDQNSNHVWNFKVPKKFGRVREGDIWRFTLESDAAFNGGVQIIYKFYR